MDGFLDGTEDDRKNDADDDEDEDAEDEGGNATSKALGNGLLTSDLRNAAAEESNYDRAKEGWDELRCED